MKEDCLSRSKHLLLNADETNEDANKTQRIVGGTQTYLNKGETRETNQELLDMRNVFRGTLVNNWKWNEINESIDFKCNELMMKESVSFYHEY